VLFLAQPTRRAPQVGKFGRTPLLELDAPKVAPAVRHFQRDDEVRQDLRRSTPGECVSPGVLRAGQSDSPPATMISTADKSYPHASIVCR
jgi:hypothetical protein